MVTQPYSCTDIFYGPLCTWLFSLHVYLSCFWSCWIVGRSCSNYWDPKNKEGKNNCSVRLWSFGSYVTWQILIYQCLFHCCIIVGPSWPLCLDWTMRRVRGTSRSSTRHQSSPERAPRQVRPSEQRHHSHHGNPVLICLNVCSVRLQLGRNQLHLLELLQCYSPQQSRPSDSEDPVFNSWIFQLSSCVF